MTETCKSPLVSIGIPAFNRPHGLERVLAAMVRQTFRDIEILISDDCSPDAKTNETAKRFEATDDRIVVFKQPCNIGSLANQEFLIKRARGKYFMWAHDDDEFPMDYVEVCLRHFKDGPDIVLVGPSCDRYFEGKYLSSYQNWSSVGDSTYRRLRGLMPDAFRCHWRFEQYLSGLFLREAAPEHVSKDFKSQFYLFFFLSERGALQHAPEIMLIKNTSQDNYDKYDALSHYRRRAMLRKFGSDMQECIPITGQMLAIISRSSRLKFIEKVRLTSRCAWLFIKYPFFKELRENIVPRARRKLCAPLRGMSRLRSASRR